MATAGAVATIIMERRHQYVTILTAYPPEAFSTGNELSLKMAGTAAESLRIMVVQNQRGRSSMAIAFFLIGSNLCLACSRILPNEDAEGVYHRFLTEGTVFNGFLSIPFNAPDESSMYRGGFSVSLECVNVGALTYRFTIGPAHRETARPAGNKAMGVAIQVNVDWAIPSEFFSHVVTRHSQETRQDEVVELLLQYWDTESVAVSDEDITEIEKRRMQLLVESWQM
jgi:hypothetical protein